MVRDYGIGTTNVVIEYGATVATKPHPWMGSAVSAARFSGAGGRYARGTGSATGVGDRVGAVQEVGLGSRASGSASLIALNPPFHEGAAINKDLAPELFADAVRVLAPGGQLWTVWNSHLQYRGALERIVGPTEQVARNVKFTVARSVRGR